MGSSRDPDARCVEDRILVDLSVFVDRAQLCQGSDPGGAIGKDLNLLYSEMGRAMD